MYKIAFVFIGCMALSSCGGSNDISSALPRANSPHVNNKTKFSSAAYGVAASPRVTTSRKVRKGGGRRQIGKPYKIKGKWYTPKEEIGYDKVGKASWYGPNFHGRLTANGEVYDQYALSAAHPTFPLPSYARVTNVANGRSVVVRVNDRGPYHPGRIIDLSARASELLNYQKQGVATLRVQYIKQAPLHGLDGKQLAATYRANGSDYAVASNALSEPSAVVDTSTVRAQERAGVASRLKRNIPIGRRLDTFATGSVSKKSSDPFLEELAAVNAKRDRGSTLFLRLFNGAKTGQRKAQPFYR